MDHPTSAVSDTCVMQRYELDIQIGPFERVKDGAVP